MVERKPSYRPARDGKQGAEYIQEFILMHGGNHAQKHPDYRTEKHRLQAQLNAWPHALGQQRRHWLIGKLQ